MDVSKIEEIFYILPGKNTKAKSRVHEVVYKDDKSDVRICSVCNYYNKMIGIVDFSSAAVDLDDILNKDAICNLLFEYIFYEFGFDVILAIVKTGSYLEDFISIASDGSDKVLNDILANQADLRKYKIYKVPNRLYKAANYSLQEA